MAALEWAARIADHRRLPLRLVHAGRAGRDLLEEAHDRLREANGLLQEAEAIARAAGAQGEVSSHLIPGEPGHVLVAESERAHLVVVASRGHSRMHDTFASSTAMYTVTHCRCPVVVIRPEQPAGEDMREAVGRVLVGVDGTPLSADVIDFAFREAERLGVGVTALHTWIQPVASGHDALVPFAGDLEALQHENEAILSESLAATIADHPDVDVRQVTMQIAASVALIESSMGARLVVIGSRGRGPIAGLLLGSTSQAVLHNAGCPVAIIHAPR